jgi:transcription elongation factor Elf1
VKPRPTAYYTEEPCPTCGHPLVLVDDTGSGELARAECRACGHAEDWLFANPWTMRGDNW